MFYTWKLNLVLLLSHFLANIDTANIDDVLSMLFSQCWSNADEHTLNQLSFSTKYQQWNNIGSSALNRRDSFNVVWTLFFQKLYHELGLESLEKRRWYRKLCCFYKIFRSQSPQYLFNIIPTSVRPYNTRNADNIP